MDAIPALYKVEVINVPSIRIAAMEHHGTMQTIATTAAQFIAWRQSCGLSPDNHATYNLIYNQNPAQIKIDLAVSVDENFCPQNANIKLQILDLGKAAYLRVIGKESNVAPAIGWLYQTWLPTSGEKPRTFPLVLQRVKFFPEVAEDQTIVDILLALA